MMNDDERKALESALTENGYSAGFAEVILESELDMLVWNTAIAYAQKWRSMESAPKDGTRIFVFARKYYAAVCWDESGDGSFQWEDYDCNRWSPTHWMPLPLPPTEAK